MTGRKKPFRKRRNWLWLAAVIVSLAVVPAVFFLTRTPSTPQEEISLSELEKELIPAVGTATSYGLPLSWNNAVEFANWFDETDLSSSEEKTLRKALSPISTPCCDDTQIVKCCCEKSGQICNLVRSARGLAGWLIQQRGFSANETSAAVQTWLAFAHRGYYLAKALSKQGISPARYGLTTEGSCYRSECDLPLQSGGCGGMVPELGV